MVESPFAWLLNMVFLVCVDAMAVLWILTHLFFVPIAILAKVVAVSQH